MEEDFDLNLSPDTTLTKQAPKQGRRAKQNAFSTDAKDDKEDLGLASPLKAKPMVDDLFGEAGGGKAGLPLKGRRRGGWGSEDRAKTAKSVRISSAVQSRFEHDDVDHDEDAGDIPVIPDLDDVMDEDMTLQVADAPSVAVNRVATYKELDNDLLKHVAFATVDDIDLRLLTKCLAPESKLKELDDPWGWDVLFAEVSGELQKEWNPEEEEQEKQEAAAERPYTAFNRNFGRAKTAIQRRNVI